MFTVDIGDDGDNWRKLEERAVAFVRFHHQEIAVAHARVRSAHGADAPPHHHRRVQPRMVEDSRRHGCGGRLSVAAADRDTVLKAHQFGKQLAAGDNGDLQSARFLHFRILLIHRRAHHQRPRAGHIGRREAFVDRSAQGGKALGNGRELQVRPGDPIAEIQQHLGDTAHADASDTGEVQNCC